MLQRTDRRAFLRTAAAGGTLVGLGELGFLAGLRPVEPLVRLLEETPREQVVAAFADRIRGGASYQQVLAALLLAGVRNVQPRPSVGFKFHAVLVVNSAHLASLASADSDRWLPIFWALDYYKSAEATDVREGNWTMAPVNESQVPPAHQAHDGFVQALEKWDVEQADGAVASLARSAGAAEIFEIFARYGARDYRSIGHKAIFVANSFRTLHCIGWRYAEPVLRSLAYALLNHSGEPNPATSDLEPDRAWRLNQQLAQEIRKDWRDGKPDAEATQKLLVTLRDDSYEAACKQVVEMLNAGVAPQSIYDALFMDAGELLVRQPGIVALHAVTTTNALHYAFQTAQNDETRRLLLLQNAAFLPHFRQSMHGRGKVGEQRLDELKPMDVADAGNEGLGEVFANVSSNPQVASQQLLGLLDTGVDAGDVLQTARRLIFAKGTDSHDYKFSSAVLEDFYSVSPQWRNRFLASSVFRLRGSGDGDNGLVDRVRAALS
jgi:hypothetical protein